MKFKTILSVSIFLFGLFVTVLLFAQSQSVLEKYTFQLGQTAGTALSFTDQRIGDGDVSFRLNYRLSETGDAEIHVEVFRYVPPGVIDLNNFILNKIDLIFLDSAGRPIRTVLLDKVLGNVGFSIVSSTSGFFSYNVAVKDLSRARGLTVRLSGHYET
jgi:hypothetical protein